MFHHLLIERCHSFKQVTNQLGWCHSHKDHSSLITSSSSYLCFYISRSTRVSDTPSVLNKCPESELASKMNYFSPLLLTLCCSYQHYPFIDASLKIHLFLVVKHGMWHLSSPSRDWSRTPRIGSTGSQPLDHQGYPTTQALMELLCRGQFFSALNYSSETWSFTEWRNHSVSKWMKNSLIYFSRQQFWNFNAHKSLQIS